MPPPPIPYEAQLAYQREMVHAMAVGRAVKGVRVRGPRRRLAERYDAPLTRELGAMVSAAMPPADDAQTRKALKARLEAQVITSHPPDPSPDPSPNPFPDPSPNPSPHNP